VIYSTKKCAAWVETVCGMLSLGVRLGPFNRAACAILCNQRRLQVRDDALSLDWGQRPMAALFVAELHQQVEEMGDARFFRAIDLRQGSQIFGGGINRPIPVTGVDQRRRQRNSRLAQVLI
jgi:hypothetical protein